MGEDGEVSDMRRGEAIAEVERKQREVRRGDMMVCKVCGWETDLGIFDYSFDHEFGTEEEYRVGSVCCEGEIEIVEKEG